jgi:hypothetical protein
LGSSPRQVACRADRYRSAVHLITSPGAWLAGPGDLF